MLDQSTKQLEGWFSSGWEWMLYPLARIDDYERYDRKEDDKCVPLLNGTGKRRSEFRRLEGKKVIVEGHTMRYDDLPIGPNLYDQILFKRHYNGEFVANYCYREMVFVVERVEQE